ncbi:MAG: Flp pilus assembly complex ATPase component TadA, partial [Candidatus Nomurabacteria bacterium]|jgi:type II secretory ATPase GspE/PulE/Tfp pilus assembly ATPase PilB-like protein|nr:Flp pilus assembly complex ATPase component TadA [Candidatus Nomurabacteria bacterium]
LNALNDTERKIITLEDPVEFDIEGVTQIPIDTDKGQSFAEGLRTILRLDPDVVMVGEIRDADTARTAIQASITGHLVLCTFHAQDAASAFARIVDIIGVNPIFATAIRVVIGQRLVRKLDDDLKQEFKPDAATAKYIKDNLKDLAKDVRPDLENLKLYKPGKSEADPFGYKGRTVLMEQLIVTEPIQQFLRGEAADLSVSAIEKTARAGGMITMLQKGILKALAGETTLDEVERVL